MTPAELKAARERLGLTQVQVAAALGMAIRTYQVYEATGPVPRWVSRRAATMIHQLHDAADANRADGAP
jgi:transcriptional regulator with XRE-family HTH domain